MHKYQPRIHILKTSPPFSPTTSEFHSHDPTNRYPYQPQQQQQQQLDLLQQLSGAAEDRLKSFCFPETAFTAVTAYQNQLVSASFAFLYHNSEDQLSN